MTDDTKPLPKRDVGASLEPLDQARQIVNREADKVRREENGDWDG